MDLPKSLIRNYRLTLDYEEDLKMFNKLFYLLKKKKLKNNIKNIFKVMDNNKSLVNINKSKKLVYTQKAFSTNLYRNTILHVELITDCIYRCTQRTHTVYYMQYYNCKRICV